MTECIKGTEGLELILRNGNKTLELQPKLTYVPWVTVNGKFDSAAHKQIEMSIVKWACSVSEVKGEICEQFN